MVGSKYTKYLIKNQGGRDVVVKMKGSEALKTILKPGDIKRISEHFNLDYHTVRFGILGRNFTHNKVIQCAEKIALFYEEIQLDKTVNEIIESYEAIN